MGLGEFPDKDGDLRVRVRTSVPIFDDLIVARADIGLGLGGDILIEVTRGRGVSEDDQLPGAVVDAVEAIGRGAANVAVGVIEFGVVAEVFDAAGEELDHRLVGDEGGLGLSGWFHGLLGWEISTC